MFNLQALVKFEKTRGIFVKNMPTGFNICISYVLPAISILTSSVNLLDKYYLRLGLAFLIKRYA